MFDLFMYKVVHIHINVSFHFWFRSLFEPVVCEGEMSEMFG